MPETYRTYDETPFEMVNFKIEEFDSPDAPGSGHNMRISTINLLLSARSNAPFPFHINSGFRTKKHNKDVGGERNSAHLDGFAVDIRAMIDGKDRRKELAKLLVGAGFTGIGIGKTFIHADNHPRRRRKTWWTYDGVKDAFNPFKL